MHPRDVEVNHSTYDSIILGSSNSSTPRAMVGHLEVQKFTFCELSKRNISHVVRTTRKAGWLGAFLLKDDAGAVQHGTACWPSGSNDRIHAGVQTSNQPNDC